MEGHKIVGERDVKKGERVQARTKRKGGNRGREADAANARVDKPKLAEATWPTMTEKTKQERGGNGGGAAIFCKTIAKKV